MNDHEISEVIRQVLAGNPTECSPLVREFGLPVRSFIHARVRNSAYAEDLAQESFIAAFLGLARFETGQSFEAWLIGIARHRVLGHFRTTERRHSAPQKFREECLSRIGNDLHEVEEEIGREPLKRLMDCVEKDGSETATLLNASRGAIHMLQLPVR